MTQFINQESGSEFIPGQPRSPRMQKIIDEARAMLRESGWSNVSMRRLAARLDVKAPSLYKHISGKEQLLHVLLSETLENLGQRLHEAIEKDPSPQSLLAAYRAAVHDDPHGYRLMSRTRFVSMTDPNQLDSHIRDAFFKVAGTEQRGLAMWAFAHGLIMAELIQDGGTDEPCEESVEHNAAERHDERTSNEHQVELKRQNPQQPGVNLEAIDAIWAAGAEAFSPPAG